MNHDIKKHANVSRRTWDKEKYENIAQEKAALAGADNKNDEFYAKQKRLEELRKKHSRARRRNFRAADAGAAGPEGSKRAYLKIRETKIDYESKVGTSEIVMETSAPSVPDPLSLSDVCKKAADGIGWYCSVCECTLKDSRVYLDHVNGKNHQRALGFSMRVEQASLESVEENIRKLTGKRHNRGNTNNLKSDPSKPLSLKERLKRKREEGLGRAAGDESDNEPGLDVVVGPGPAITAEPSEEPPIISEEEKKRLKWEKKQAKKKAKLAEKQKEEQEAAGGEDSDMAAVMGFSGFG